MGEPSEQHGLADALREGVLLALRHDAHDAGEVAPRPRGSGPAQDCPRPRAGGQEAERHPHERGLAAPVRTEHRVECAGPQSEAHPGEGVPDCPRVAIGDVARVENQLAVHRRSSSAKTGTPTRAVTMPTGSSRGATKVRATVSERASSVPPPRKAAGSSGRCWRAHSARIASGTTRPTKPITPDTDA